MRIVVKCLFLAMWHHARGNPIAAGKLYQSAAYALIEYSWSLLPRATTNTYTARRDSIDGYRP